MYKKETQAIGRLFEKTMMQAFGPENIKQHFAAFDTICDATQVRQDAVNELSDMALNESPIDFILVVGGWDSSNTAHLLEIPHERGLRGYHVNTAQCIRPDNSVEHRDVEGGDYGRLSAARPPCASVSRPGPPPDSVRKSAETIALVKLSGGGGGGEVRAVERHMRTWPPSLFMYSRDVSR